MSTSSIIEVDPDAVEYYSQSKFIEAAREVMGGIDLDPASCAEANERVNATVYFTKEDYPLLRDWFGRVWMNHPFGKQELVCEPNCNKLTCQKRGYHSLEYKPGNNDWIEKIIHEYEIGNVTEACCITYASTSETWARKLLNYPNCFLYPRTGYHVPGGELKREVQKGSMITYFGSRLDKFISTFEIKYELGKVKI